ncbi:hypothetical protein [Metabacillus fastidiosus]|uniref:hypothetical protein n=1 Tax=Metabacillus fastidiosus TaxID=1458 RepID=UPI002DB9BC3E|nr:hypothetical protein [Metabacillus fastidiosus]MEC2077421.1 hypothetical protein [Metabacillus fastidiosus]
MYKIMTLLTLSAVLTACSSDDIANKGNEKQEQKEEVNVGVETTEEWSSLPEYEKIMEVIDRNDYTFQTMTDNQGKRILFLTNNNGEKIYKTVFVKNEKRLKIIKVDGSGEIFNDIIN